MPASPIIFGPYSSVFVGDGPPSVAVLTELRELRTGGGFVHWDQPETFLDVLDNEIPTDRQRISVSLTFVEKTANVQRLAMGGSISTPTTAALPGIFSTYTILLLSPDPDSSDNIFIPKCTTAKRFDINREKRKQQEIPILFKHQSRNPHKRLYYNGTLTELLALSQMTGRSPF